MTDLEKISNLTLHETIQFGYFHVTRVIGGFIYIEPRFNTATFISLSELKNEIKIQRINEFTINILIKYVNTGKNETKIKHLKFHDQEEYDKYIFAFKKSNQIIELIPCDAIGNPLTTI